MSINSEEVHGRILWSDEKIWINSEQYFNHVPEALWSMRVGGYVPLQKWLGDRKGECLSLDDIKHYQLIIGALNKSIHVLGEIDAEYRLTIRASVSR
ncbi:type ISP restriction/modification enzyme [Bradyrhizobium sp. AZCC 2289]|uniref:type ISP restriction/modification enzyme n=1 Tax=Bradyrhizobium sp. AZCC 2289 TaxID=3117026 RepID=UPI003FA5ADE1